MCVCVCDCRHTSFKRAPIAPLLVPLTHLHHNDRTWKEHTNHLYAFSTCLRPLGPPPPQPSLLTSPETIIPTQQPPPPTLLNGRGWEGVKVITGPWIFVPTHFISVRLPTGKSMSSALMKDLHLCPMDLLVFIFSPNMVSMRSPDTVAHVSYSMWHRCMSAHSHVVMEEGRLFTKRAECANFHHVQVVLVLH